jgi:hypothetical protein
VAAGQVDIKKALLRGLLTYHPVGRSSLTKKPS